MKNFRGLHENRRPTYRTNGARDRRRIESEARTSEYALILFKKRLGHDDREPRRKRQGKDKSLASIWFEVSGHDDIGVEHRANGWHGVDPVDSA